MHCPTFTVWSKNFLNRKYLFAVWLALTVGGQALSAQDILRSNFDNATEADNPWAGVSGEGVLSVISGQQLAVNDAGDVIPTTFPPSVAVGDLNGDGLQDLVIGDSSGFFWYFLNSGTPVAPKFTHGEIMPIWLGFGWGDPLYLGGEGANNIVPKVQLVDMAGDGKLLSLVVGNYVGRLFYVRNQGTPGSPIFRMPQDRSLLVVPTKKNKELWSNYLSPFAYDWFHRGNLDLIMGDGGYSANSIFLFKNQDVRDHPIFNQDAMTKIIPGMGREHLTPQVVDWNNDGKPDIIAGERTGHINIFLNTSSDPLTPSFDEGHYVKLGANDTFGQLTTATVCDLTSSKLPNLIVTNSDGKILYAKNTGTLGAPQFGDPQPIHGINPFPKILRPKDWALTSPNGVPHELLVTTNAKLEPGFLPPPNTAFKSALRYYVYPVQNTYFKNFYYPTPDTEGVEPHIIAYNQGISLTEKAQYQVSFWIRTTGSIQNLSYTIRGFAHYSGNPNEEVIINKPVSSGETWNQFSDIASFRLKSPSDTPVVVGFGFNLSFNGQGEVYLDNVVIRPAP